MSFIEKSIHWSVSPTKFGIAESSLELSVLSYLKIKAYEPCLFFFMTSALGKKKEKERKTIGPWISLVFTFDYLF